MAKKKNNYIIVITSIVLVLCIAASVIGGLSKGFTDWDAKNWGKQANNGGTIDPINGDNSGLTVGDVITNGMRLSASAAEAGGITLTATITPESAVDKTVTWSYAWADSAVTDDVKQFVTVTPSFVGSLTATVDCLKAFGNQIKIKVVSNANEEAFAEITVDYAKRVISTAVSATGSDVTWNFNTANTTIDLLPVANTSAWKSAMSLTRTFEKGIGTIDNTAASTSTYYVKPTANFVSAYGAGSTEYWMQLDSINQYNIFKTISETDFFPLKSGSTIVRVFKPALWNPIAAALAKMNSSAFQLRVVTTNPGGTVETIYNVKINNATIGGVATSIELNQSSIIF